MPRRPSRFARFRAVWSAAPLLALAALAAGAGPPATAEVRGLAEAESYRSPDGLARIHLLLEPARPGTAYLGRATFLPGASAPEHRHAESEEILYVLSGHGTMTLAGVEVDIHPDQAIRIPAGVSHSFRVTGEVPIEVVQVYSPAGPEQRFKSWSREPEAPAGEDPR